MRLLETRGGDLHLTDELHDEEIPPYATLSHTWGHPRDEVTYKDIIERRGQDKAGYEKIKFCGEQAARDGLRYFWVDSCCIDRSSSAELQEAIISMFRWYRGAQKCYAYMADVSTAAGYTIWNWEPAFRRSRWFTRGWTLQELLAPSAVEFFSREGTLLGSKDDLRDLVAEITGIDAGALRGVPMPQFEIDERLAWVARRQTTRGEDEAYCLFGIFGVSMPVMYGEGRENAMSRLRTALRQASRSENEPRNQPFIPPPAAATQRRKYSLLKLEFPPGLLDVVAFSPDGATLAIGCTDSTVMLWDRGSWTLLYTLRRHAGGVSAVAFSPDNKTLATAGGDGIARLWDYRSQTALCALRGPKRRVNTVAWSPDGETLATGSSDGSIMLWDGQSGAARQVLNFHWGYVSTLAFSPADMLVSGGKDRAIRVIDYRSGQLLRKLEGHADLISAVAFSPDGLTLATASADKTVKLWNYWSVRARRTIKMGEDSVQALAFSPHGELATGSANGSLKLWDVQSGAEVHTFDGQQGFVRAVALSSDGAVASVSGSGAFRLWT